MRYNIIMDLAKGFSTTTQQLRNHFLPMGKTLVKQFHFYSGPSSTLRFSSQIATTNHQPKCRSLGKAILRHFSCAFSVSSDKRFGAGSRGVPKPIQPMSLLNPGLWRLLAGFFPKAGIRLPLLRNFRNRCKRLQRIFDTLRGLLRKLYDGSENTCVKRVLLHATQFKAV